MAGSNSWRIALDGDDYLRQQEKRLLNEERRPVIRTAAALLGPGIAPYAVQVTDWNADETGYNGFFYSEPLAQNSPDGTKYWMGTSFAAADGYGFQKVTEFRGGGSPPDEYVRTFATVAGTLRTFSAWVLT